MKTNQTDVQLETKLAHFGIIGCTVEGMNVYIEEQLCRYEWPGRKTSEEPWMDMWGTDIKNDTKLWTLSPSLDLLRADMLELVDSILQAPSK